MRFLLALLMLVGSIDGLKEQPFVTKDEFAALQQTLKQIVGQMKEMKEKNVALRKEIYELREIEEAKQLNDTTIEERVSVLEFQMSNVQEDITTINTEIIVISDDITNINTDVETLEDEVIDLDEDVESQLTIIAAEQVLQDERLLAIEENDQAVQESIVVLQTTDVDLTSQITEVNNRVTTVNNTVSDINIRVEDLDDRVSVLEAKATLTNRRQTNEDVLVSSDKQNELQNSTIEERVTVLEFQVDSINNDINIINDEIIATNNDVTTLNNDVETLETEVRDLDEDLESQITVISAEQVLQDERLFTLEENEEAIFGTLTEQQETDVELNLAIVAVEDNVATVNDSLEETTSVLDGRIGRLELNGTIAFQADLDAYTSIPAGSAVVFDVVDLNIGGGYNSATGEFTVPTGGDGLYFLYINFYADDDSVTDFVIRLNGNTDLCYARADQNGASADNGTPSCGAVTTLSAGNVVNVIYLSGTDDTPVNSDTRPYNTFTGFRIAPE